MATTRRCKLATLPYPELASIRLEVCMSGAAYMQRMGRSWEGSAAGASSAEKRHEEAVLELTLPDWVEAEWRACHGQNKATLECRLSLQGEYERRYLKMISIYLARVWNRCALLIDQCRYLSRSWYT